MFQNITKHVEPQNDEADIKINNKFNIKQVIQSLLKGQNILLYIISFMLSLVSGNIGLDYSIFALAIFAAACSNGIPTGILYIITMVATLIKFETSGLL